MGRDLLLGFVEKVFGWGGFRASIRGLSLWLVRTDLLISIVFIPQVIVGSLFNELCGNGVWILELVIILGSVRKACLPSNIGSGIFSWVLRTVALSSALSN